MKHTLKGWLVDNAVTIDDKEDKILMLESAGSLTMADIIEEMKKEDTGLRTETGEHGAVPCRAAVPGRHRERGMEPGEELHLRLLHAGQGIARGDCRNVGEHPGRQGVGHVHLRREGCRDAGDGRHGDPRAQLHHLGQAAQDCGRRPEGGHHLPQRGYGRDRPHRGHDFGEQPLAAGHPHPDRPCAGRVHADGDDAVFRRRCFPQRTALRVPPSDYQRLISPRGLDRPIQGCWISLSKGIG